MAGLRHVGFVVCGHRHPRICLADQHNGGRASCNASSRRTRPQNHSGPYADDLINPEMQVNSGPATVRLAGFPHSVQLRVPFRIRFRGFVPGEFNPALSMTSNQWGGCESSCEGEGRVVRELVRWLFRPR